MIKSLLTTVLWLALTGAAWAQTDTPPSTDTDLQAVERLRKAAKNSHTDMKHLRKVESFLHDGGMDRVLTNSLNALHKIAPGGVYSENAHNLYNARERAIARGRMIGRYLALDLDANQEISASERAFAPKDFAAATELLFFEGDVDDNRVITLSELIEFIEPRLPHQERAPAPVPLHLYDYDADGEVDRQDIVRTLLAIQRSQERIATAPPVAIVRTGTTKRPKPVFQPGQCTAPPPPPGAEMFVFSTERGTALSTVAVAGTHTTTTLGRLIIEPGETPVYLFLSSFTPMIWDITGATQRLTHVVVQKGAHDTSTGAGVIGVPAEQITFVEHSTCIEPFTRTDGREDAHAYSQIQASFARLPTAVQAVKGVGVATLPSGRRSSLLALNDTARKSVIGGLKLRALPPDAFAQIATTPNRTPSPAWPKPTNGRPLVTRGWCAK